MASDNVSFTLASDASREAEEIIEEQYKNKSEGLRGLLELAANDKVHRIAEYYDVDVVEAVKMAVDGYIVPDESGDPLEHYDPDEENVTLSKDALREVDAQNPTHKVNPDHIDSLPQKIVEKQDVLTAIIRYEVGSGVVTEQKVIDYCMDVLGVREKTVRREYLDAVWDSMYPHPRLDDDVRLASKEQQKTIVREGLLSIPEKAEKAVDDDSGWSVDEVLSSWQHLKEYEDEMVLLSDDEYERVEESVEGMIADNLEEV